MSRPSASLSTVKGFGLTFNDLTAFANHFLASPSPPVRDVPSASENRSPAHARTPGSFILPESNPSQGRGYRHRYSSSSTSSSGSSRSSYAPLSPTSYSQSSSYAPTSPRAHNLSQFIDHRPRRLTQRERAELAHYTAPEMDIADMVGVYGDTNFEPLR